MEDPAPYGTPRAGPILPAPPRPGRRARRWFLAALVLLAALGACEAAIRIWDAKRGYPPFFHETLGVYPALLSDPLLRVRRRPNYTIESAYIGGSRWSFNSQGHRGRQEYTVPKPPGVFRVLCIGGSTTASSNVSCDEAAWTARLQSLWNERGGPEDKRVEVVNQGVVGWTSVQALAYFQTEGLDLEPDVVTSMEAINDIQAASVEGIDAGSRPWMQKWWFRAWEHRTRVDNLLGFSRLYWVLRNRARSLNTPPDPEPLVWRTESVHPMGPVYFRRNLENLVRTAAARGIRPVLMTQPCTLLWDDPALHNVARHNPVFRPNPQGKALSLEAYVRTHRQYNDIVREVARAEGATLVDLAELTAQRAGMMDDTVHETDAGAVVRAGLILDVLSK